MSKLRFDVVQDAFRKKAVDIEVPETRPSEYFGELVFNREKMHKYLPADVYHKMMDVMDNGATLDLQTADIVAEGMKGALITTIFGIIVALILQVFYNFILSKIEHLTSQMEESAVSLLDIIMKHKSRHA